MSDIVLVSIFVENEIFTVLINSVIRQMHAQVPQIAPHRRHVLLGGKACEAFMENESSQRIYSSDQHIDSEVKL